jgi:hypothetical protein
MADESKDANMDNESRSVDDDSDDNDNDSADINTDGPEPEELDPSKSAASDDDDSIENTGVEAIDNDNDDESIKNTGVEDIDDDDDDNEPIENTGVQQPTQYKRFVQAEESGRAAAGSNDNKPRTRSTAAQEFIHSMFEDMDPNSIFELMSSDDADDMLSFITAQMMAKAGLKYFGQDGAMQSWWNWSNYYTTKSWMDARQETCQKSRRKQL